MMFLPLIGEDQGQYLNIQHVGSFKTSWNYFREGVEGETGYCVIACTSQTDYPISEHDTPEEAAQALAALIRQLNHGC